MQSNTTHFLQKPAAPGVVLISIGIIAMIISNSPLAPHYFSVTHAKAPIDVLFWVNDVLMVIFFLDVGLEIKQQITTGHLSKIKQALLPAIAACGGVLVPALFFLILNNHNAIARHGWGIPTATDIAFSLGVILLLGKRIPSVLHVLLLAIAIFDDLIAIIIIAFFYSKGISLTFLILSIISVAALWCLNISKQKTLLPYAVFGVILWFCCLKSGIHPTISGALIAFTLPTVLGKSIHKHISFAVAFVILPIFAFTNAGVQIKAVTFNELFDPVTIGIAFGLIFGKQLGIFSFALLSMKARLTELPREITLVQFYGMAILCGIGFTMSMFIANLSYTNISYEYFTLSKVGILLGSTIAAIFGYIFLRYFTKAVKRSENNG